MFYRLVSFDDRPLPTPGRVGEHKWTIVDGGLLLEPPNPGSSREPNEGYAVLRFFRRASLDESGLLGWAAEAYRWLANGELEISSSLEAKSSVLRGRQHHAELTLVCAAPDSLLELGTTLGLVADQDSPIPEAWRDILYFGGGLIGLAKRPHGDSEEEALAALQKYQAELEPRMRQAARERLERAWRAPA